MRAGLLNKRVEVQSRAVSQNSHGDQERTWSTYLTTYARIEPLSGRELIAAAAVQNVGTHRVTMRFNATVQAKHRLKLGARVFNIVTPPRNTDERNREMVFEVEEGLERA